MDFANYADDTTPDVCDSKIEALTQILENNFTKIFQSFSESKP